MIKKPRDIGNHSTRRAAEPEKIINYNAGQLLVPCKQLFTKYGISPPVFFTANLRGDFIGIYLEQQMVIKPE
jgi:hypothetical protein